MEHHVFGAGGGYLEVLFRRQTKPFRRLADLHAENYTMIGSPIPAKELLKPYDLYVLLHQGGFGAPSRAVTHGDVINVCLPLRTCTYVLLLPATIKTTMEPGRYNLDIDDKYPLGMQLLPQRFPSFALERTS